ncbi:MAG: hypothetical protein OXD46_10275 [Chloroflexi bacterium]|nr:hypothetical protein [Chloroflexota bacterium]
MTDPPAANTPSSDRSPQTFVSSVRDIDLSQASDAELRPRAVQLGHGPLDEDALAECFAIIDETIKRRIGAWQLFDSEFDHTDAAHCRETNDDPHATDKLIADMLAYVAEESASQYYSSIDLPSEFYNAIKDSLFADALRFEPTDEQIEAGRLMLDRTVVEMDAGEGKTVAAAFPAITRALSGRKVHVITANDYLALRDAELLAPAYEFLGLTVGVVLSHMGDAERRIAYRNGIVYGTLREIGFDYLRDNLRHSRVDMVQGGLEVAIVDEADHALVDDGRTPLIISGKPGGSVRSVFRVKSAVGGLIQEQKNLTASLVDEISQVKGTPGVERYAKLYLADPRNPAIVSASARDSRLLSRMRAVIDTYSEEGIENKLTEGLFFTTDLRRGLVALTAHGIAHIEDRLGPVFDAADLLAELEAIEADRDVPLVERRRRNEAVSRRISRQYGVANQVHQMLRAYQLLTRDEDYIVADGRVVLVDDLTGRRKTDSKYQYGLQAALEAKEGVRVRPDPRTQAYLTVEGLVRQYDHISGMTGTALEAHRTFRRAFGLDVARVEPASPSRRVDRPPRVFAARSEKLGAIVDEVTYWNSMGRPVLIGTRTVEQSDEISRLLTEAQVAHNRLDAVRNGDEARTVREAGSFGAVTVATNMAGRGTDILLDDDLDRRVTDRFVRMLAERRLTERRPIRVDCGHGDVADTLAARTESLGLPFHVAETALLIEGAGDETSMEFGLGLHVIGTEMNEAARVDRQLRGRSGRQGQHGSSLFILSLEDRPFVTASRRLAQPDAENAGRLIEQIQSSIERDAEALRIVSYDLARIIERQTLNYYAARNAVLDDRSFDESCRNMTRDVIRRLLERLLPATATGDYSSRFDDLADTVRLDFGIDIEDLDGLDPESLLEEIFEAVITQFGDAGANLGPRKYTRLTKALALQVSDGLWSEHLDLVQDLIVNAQLSMAGHNSVVAELVFRAEDAYRKFMEQAADSFISRLATFEVDEDTGDDDSIVLADDVEAILV